VIKQFRLIEKILSTKLTDENLNTYLDLKVYTSINDNSFDLSGLDRMKKGLTFEVNANGASIDYEYVDVSISIGVYGTLYAYNNINETPSLVNFYQSITFYPNITGKTEKTVNTSVLELTKDYKYVKSIETRKYNLVLVSGYLRKRN
jgi:hypothetical protein